MRNMLRFLKGYEKESILAPLFKMLEACFELFVPLCGGSASLMWASKTGELAYIRQAVRLDGAACGCWE